MNLFSLQDKPSLLVPWMVYTILFLIANTILFILNALQYFSIRTPSVGAVCGITIVLYVGK